VKDAGRLARNPDLLLCWRGRQLLVVDLRTGRDVLAAPSVVKVLDALGSRATVAQAAERLRAYEPKAVAKAIRELRAAGLVLRADEAARRRSRLAIWRHNLASAFYHAACRDIRFLERPLDIEKYLRAHVVSKPRPARFKRYPDAPRTALPDSPGSDAFSSLNTVLRARRTCRAFAKRAVAVGDLAAILRGTFGRVGFIVDPVLGRLTAKTSPSAGGLHPLECYVLAWNVAGLPHGIYHYDVAGDELRLLRRTNPKTAAVKAASGQVWIGGAGFLCVLTAVFTRTLWKYAFESAYRTLWLDAGHLGQTFSLLATARGLGPFTTAAIQDTHIERLLGLDNAREFPVYLMGAGVPARVVWPERHVFPPRRS
jgi:SagB-type dehydrogenase family enzyme